MRPYLLFVSGAAGLAGLALIPDGLSLPVFLATFIPCWLGYGFGQALTDCSQIDTDAISSPYRPLVQGVVSPRAVRLVSLTALVAISGCVIYLNTATLLFLAMAITGLATYTYFKKNFWFAGPFYNGWIVMLLPLLAFLAPQAGGLELLKSFRVWGVALMTLFAYSNFVLMGYLKDITADRQTGYQTFPVVFGWRATTIVGDIFVVLSVVFCLLVADLSNAWALSLIVAASLIALLGQGHAHLTKDKTEANSSLAIASTVRSFILWHLAVTLSYAPAWSTFALTFYFCFEVVLFFRPEKVQI
jgi:4-hydroxybenzoate polyprenyltransferase